MHVGVLAFQGDVAEHIQATKAAAVRLGLSCSVSSVRTSKGLDGLDALIIPGGESTTFYKLCLEEDMLDKLKGIRNIFGTCAGAVMLAREIRNEEEGQMTLELMDISVDRNAYGRQAESFEEELKTRLGRINAVFIRAPRITRTGKGVLPLAKRGAETVACSQRAGSSFYMAACFHPELSTTLFHERFLKEIR